MNINSIIKNHIAPQYKQIGYMYNYRGEVEHSFFNNENTVQIVYDFHHRNLLLRPSVLEFTLRFFVKCGETWVYCSPSKLKCQNARMQDFFVLSSKDFMYLRGQIDSATSNILSNVISILESITLNAVVPEQKYYDMLSIEPHEQAKSFAKVHSRKMEFSAENLAWGQSWIQKLLLKGLEDRKQVFQQNVTQLIQFSAFWGEMIRIKENAQWEWVVSPDRQAKRFGIVYSIDNSEVRGYDIIARLIDFWNFSNDFEDNGLFLDFRGAIGERRQA